ncbi:hypothetical protein [Hirschia baltica]|uniref:Uncharacterized protein n=1 Tax=Hirschia baltica (strain ATCC 49814 / DSM 5838 / IFAM 1418) TaxID=582402 RepID=C6XPW4_HIRBI|nr:hypothetical protein [Hirschia baltica]ACT60379.1 hypothetical protein Hbal_2705 [Hirschia baltica ATCC 49814]
MVMKIIRKDNAQKNLQENASLNTYAANQLILGPPDILRPGVQATPKTKLLGQS